MIKNNLRLVKDFFLIKIVVMNKKFNMHTELFHFKMFVLKSVHCTKLYYLHF